MQRKILLVLASAALATLTASPALARDRHGGGHHRGGHGGVGINVGHGGGYYGGYGGDYGGYRYAPRSAYYDDPYFYDRRISYQQRGYYDGNRGYRRDHHDRRREERHH